MSSLRFLGVSTALALAAMTVAPPAHADPESDAKDLFARARDLRQKNDCTNAVPLFRKAYKVFPSGLGSLRNVAECEEQLGHFASSKRAWLDIRRALITMSQDPKYDGWDKDAQDAATRLQPKVATVYIDVTLHGPTGETIANEKSGVEIVMNNESLGTTLVGTPLDRDPGAYHVKVNAPYAPPSESDVVLAAGDVKHVPFKVTQTPPAKVAAPLTTEPPPATVDAGKGKRTAGVVLIGVGAAALIGSGVTFLVRGGAKSDVDDKCPSHNGCDPSLQSTVDRGKTMSTLTSILFPVGLVAGAAGVGLFVWGNGQKETPVVTAGLGRVDAMWRF
ncbi:MAG: hypothetical protein JWP97_1665 [Labilithrix sp.]|nr:hypothetical protein [Labilithrix sp.]